MKENRVKELYDYPFFRLAELLEDVTPSPGLKPIFLQIGEPQMAPPALLADTVAARGDLWSKYPPPKGSLEYRKAIARWLENRYAIPPGRISPENQILAVCGSREALYLAAVLAVARKMPALDGGHSPLIALPNPLYHVYYGGALMAGAEPLCIEAGEKNGFMPEFQTMTPDQLNRCAMIYLCTPGNPVGAVASRWRLQEMLKLARHHDFILAVDECYSEIWFDAAPAGGLEAAWHLDGHFDNLLVFNSLSKRSSAPGIRTGFVAGDTQLVADFAMLRAYGGAQVPGPLMAAAAALWSDEAHVEANRCHYRNLLNIADKTLGHLPGYHRPEAAFFLWLNVAKSGLSGVEATKLLWQNHAVKVQAGRYMSRTLDGRSQSEAGKTPGDDYIRIALVYDRQTMQEGLSRIARFLEG